MQTRANPFQGKSVSEIQIIVLRDMQLYFSQRLYSKMPDRLYNIYTPVGPQDGDRKRFSQIFDQMTKKNDFSPSLLELSTRESRGIASILGMTICDALGACTEFEEYNPKGWDYIKKGFTDIPQLIKLKQLRARSGQTTIWTDDASMGLVMAYSLMLNDYKFDPTHTRYMFHLWWNHGLGNGGRNHSIGLGGNISISMQQFQQQQSPYAYQGKQNNSGNGSLMRLAPIPVAFADNVEEAMKIAGNSSLTTHNGLQAKECCRLMTAIIVALINREDDQNQNEEKSQSKKQGQNELPKWKKLIKKVCDEFKTDVESVKYLALSQQQPEELYLKQKQISGFVKFNPHIEDRNWNWKSEDFKYSKTRNNQQPGYIGSYCMDALAMALHTVWHTRSFKECALKNTNMGGDCDSVGSVAGQIAGAVYGIQREMLQLYSEMQDYNSKRFEVFLVGYKMINKKSFLGNVSFRKNVNKESNKKEVEQ